MTHSSLRGDRKYALAHASKLADENGPMRLLDFGAQRSPHRKQAPTRRAYHAQQCGVVYLRFDPNSYSSLGKPTVDESAQV